MTRIPKKLLLLTALCFAAGFTANAQLGKKLIDKAKSKARVKIEMRVNDAMNKVMDKALDKAEDSAEKAAHASKKTTTRKTTATSGTQATARPGTPAGEAAGGIEITEGTSELFVSKRGSVRGEGSKASPYKDIQKAINEAADGTVIRIAEGNYLGYLDRGWIELNKYVSLEGGWNEDFTERDPVKYVTRIQPGPQQLGTIGSALLSIDAQKDRYKAMVIDGLCFDLGLALEYFPADPSDPRCACPEGCETGRMKPVGQGNIAVKLVYGTVAGDLTIRNCVFLNSSCYALLMTIKGGHWDIYNNVFVSNLYASVEINGGLNQDTQSHQSVVDFHHNTVLFSWTRTKEMEDMGYGYRFRNSADHFLHHNIFGGNNYGAIDNCWFDTTLPPEKRKTLGAHDNYFFMNKGDMVMPGNSGGKWLYVPGARFEEVETLSEYENNAELPATSSLTKVIDEPYLKGYASLSVLTMESYDENSAANQFREAFGLNKRGTSTTRVSMFGNRYNFDKALLLFGVEAGYGAQYPGK